MSSIRCPVCRDLFVPENGKVPRHFLDELCAGSGAAMAIRVSALIELTPDERAVALEALISARTDELSSVSTLARVLDAINRHRLTERNIIGGRIDT